MKGVLMLWCCLLTFLLHGQEIKSSQVLITFAVPRAEAKVESKYISNPILAEVQKIVGGKYTSDFTALYKVVPSYAVTGIRTIETFEKKYYADLSIYLRIKGVGFFTDSLLYQYTGSGSGAEERTAVQNAMNAIFAKPGFKGFASKLDSLFDARYNKNGDVTLQKIKTVPINAMKDGDHVLHELSYFNDFPAMKEKVDAYRNKVLELRSEAFCKSELPGLKISVASTVYSATEVVKKLLQVSPNASCSGEVLEVAKMIGQQMQVKQAANTPDLLPILIEVHRDRNVILWRDRRW